MELFSIRIQRTFQLVSTSIGKSGTGVHGVIVLKLKKISPREGDFPIILLRGGIADDL